MKLKLFSKKQPVHDEPTTLHTPEPTLPLLEFSIHYNNGRAEHIVFRPNWVSTNGRSFSQLEGARIFNCLQEYYPELERWRVLLDYTISTYKPLPPNLDMETIVELVGAVQIVITAMLDDYLYHRDMIAAHKEQ